MFDVAFDEFNVRIFGASKRYQLRTDVEPDRLVALLMQQVGEDARATSKIGDAGAAGHLGELHAGRYQPYITFRGENVIRIRGGMAVEERDLFLLILRWQSYHADFLARWVGFDNEG
jgi:hypothetical protein